jgi:hypothetical protein
MTMVSAPRLGFALALFAGVWLEPAPSEACSCAGPRPRLLTPDGVPLNGQVVVQLPHKTTGTLVLREAFGGPEVPIATEMHPSGWVSIAVVRPHQRLKAEQRYELVFVTPKQPPPTKLVFGSFVTGKTADDKAPTFDRPSRAVYRAEAVHRGTSCQSHERWVEIHGPPAKDDGPGVCYAVWMAPAAAKVDTTKPPHWVLARDDQVLRIGPTSMCSWLRPKVPDKKGRYQVHVAAVDGAGLRSAVHRLTFDVK